MVVFRFSKEEFRHDLSGRGAELNPGRWNSRGIPVVYAAQNISTCLAEMLVHLPLGILPPSYFVVSIFLPDDASILEIPAADLPKNWDANPHPPGTRKIGDQFVAERKHLALLLPSAVVPDEKIVVVNPQHPDFSKVEIVDSKPFPFDKRLFFR